MFGTELLIPFQSVDQMLRRTHTLQHNLAPGKSINNLTYFAHQINILFSPQKTMDSLVGSNQTMYAIFDLDIVAINLTFDFFYRMVEIDF